MPRRINARVVKMHRCYRIDQLADLVGVGIGTVRAWCNQGLPCITDKKPFLIRGRDFKAFHDERLRRAKHPLGPFEVYCLGCKRARTPVQGLVDHEPMDAARTRIMAICPTCGAMARRIIKVSDLQNWADKFGFAINMREDA